MNRRKTRAQAMTEFTAAMILIVPLLVVSCYFIAEAVQAYQIHHCLKQAASRAARSLAISYAQDPDIAVRDWAAIVSQIEYKGVVQSYRQFELIDCGFKTKQNPPMVTIKVTFKSGEDGLRKFPEPDILGISRNFEMSAVSSCKID